MSLPEIFKNKIDIKNDNDYYRGPLINDNDDIFSNLPVYVYLETKFNSFETTIIGKTTNYLVTIDKRVIYIKDIIKIEKR